MCYCWPILVSWLADHIEHTNIVGIKYNACLKYQPLKHKLGSLTLWPDLQLHLWKSVVFQQKIWEFRNTNSDSNHQAIELANDWFESVIKRPVLSIIWDLPYVKPYDLHRPGSLDNIYI